MAGASIGTVKRICPSGTSSMRMDMVAVAEVEEAAEASLQTTEMCLDRMGPTIGGRMEMEEHLGMTGKRRKTIARGG